ncbi:MAG: hypothetical protein QG566_627 [Patescibacteria group bacterium]|nr:hypothetical protein [Patescibacteria group bacterium]
MEINKNSATENNIIFEYSEIRGSFFPAYFAYIILIIGLLSGFLYTLQITILVALVRISYVVMRTKSTSINSETIKVVYKYLKKKSCELKLNDCKGYFGYSKIEDFSSYAGSLQRGIILKFSNGKSLKINISRIRVTGVHSYDIPKVHKLDNFLNLLKTRKIKNVTPEVKNSRQYTPDYPFYYLGENKRAEKAFQSQL